MLIQFTKPYNKYDTHRQGNRAWTEPVWINPARVGLVNELQRTGFVATVRHGTDPYLYGVTFITMDDDDMGVEVMEPLDVVVERLNAFYAERT